MEAVLARLARFAGKIAIGGVYDAASGGSNTLSQWLNDPRRNTALTNSKWRIRQCPRNET